eukprot:255936_1
MLSTHGIFVTRVELKRSASEGLCFVYTIETTSANGHSTLARRRLKHFRLLHQRTRRLIGDKSVTFSLEKLEPDVDDEVIQNRKSVLEDFVRHLATFPLAQEQVARFLDVATTDDYFMSPLKTPARSSSPRLRNPAESTRKSLFLDGDAQQLIRDDASGKDDATLPWSMSTSNASSPSRRINNKKGSTFMKMHSGGAFSATEPRGSSSASSDKSDQSSVRSAPLSSNQSSRAFSIKSGKSYEMSVTSYGRNSELSRKAGSFSAHSRTSSSGTSDSLPRPVREISDISIPVPLEMHRLKVNKISHPFLGRAETLRVRPKRSPRKDRPMPTTPVSDLNTLRLRDEMRPDPNSSPKVDDDPGNKETVGSWGIPVHRLTPLASPNVTISNSPRKSICRSTSPDIMAAFGRSATMKPPTRSNRMRSPSLRSSRPLLLRVSSEEDIQPLVCRETMRRKDSEAKKIRSPSTRRTVSSAISAMSQSSSEFINAKHEVMLPPTGDVYSSRKLRRRTSLIAVKQGDVLDVINRKNFKMAMKKTHDIGVSFSAHCHKLNRDFSTTKRVLAVSPSYLNILKSGSFKPSRRIELSQIEKISLSPVPDDLVVIHVRDDYANVFDCIRKTEFVMAILECCQRGGLKPPRIDVQPKIQVRSKTGEEQTLIFKAYQGSLTKELEVSREQSTTCSSTLYISVWMPGDGVLNEITGPDMLAPMDT